MRGPGNDRGSWHLGCVEIAGSRNVPKRLGHAQARRHSLVHVRVFADLPEPSCKRVESDVDDVAEENPDKKSRGGINF
jgi:hypothetical protein